MGPGGVPHGLTVEFTVGPGGAPHGLTVEFTVGPRGAPHGLTVEFTVGPGWAPHGLKEGLHIRQYRGRERGHLSLDGGRETPLRRTEDDSPLYIGRGGG